MQKLPEELISAIFGYVRIDNGIGHGIVDLKSLARISQVNKTFATIARPLLCSTFDNRNFERPLQDFLAILLGNRALIPLVREVRLEQDEDDDDDENIGNGADINFNLRLDGFASNLNLPSKLKQKIRQQIFRSSRSGYAALLLVMCPNIETLEFDDGDSDEDMSTTEMIISAEHTVESPRTYMSRLKEVIVHHLDDPDPEIRYFMQQLCWLSQYPTVHTLRGYKLVCTAGFPVDFKPCTGLKYMYLEEAEVDGPGLRSLLNVLPALEELTIDYGGGFCGYPENFYAGIGSALTEHGSQIRLFVLEVRNADWYLEPLHDLGATKPKMPFGNLSTLHNLTSISLPEVALLGSREDIMANLRDRDTLPPTVKVLEITLCSNDSDKLDDELLEVVCSNQYPDLDTIAIEREISFSYDLTAWGWISEGRSSQTWRALTNRGGTYFGGDGTREDWQVLQRRREA